MANECPKCQTNNPDESKFCGECATPLQPSKDIGVTKTIETPVEEHPRGSTFADRYKIIEKLGIGGMGAVYRVEDTNIGQDIALKLIKSDIASDKKTIERFRNELKITRMISHRNVCRMFDLAETEGIFYITMEYVSGEDLKSFIRRSGKLDIPKAISITKEVCEGLSEAHRLGVVHRDLKSSNIMIDKDGNARIMDFGIARSHSAKGLTGEGIIIGTPEYMSPEQAEAKEVDNRSDIYSLGVILYEMVTGQIPFEGDTPLAVAMKHKGEVPKDPKNLNPQIPEDLSQVILKCLEKDKENRYQSTGEVSSELENIEKGIPTTDRVIPERKPLTSKEITVTFGLKKLLIPVSIVVALFVIAVIIWQFLPKKETATLISDKPSIAVLPFADLSPEKDQEYFCDGMADELINRLTNIENLKVPARTSAFSFKGKGLDIREIGERLKVEHVLEGSIRKAGKKLRITVQLVNVVDGYPLWSEKYERDEKDIFALQDEIALAIVDKLKLKLLGGEKEKIVIRHTENLDAYNLYVKARYFWDKSTEEGIKIGLDYLHQAIEKDPNFALAYAGIAYCYIMIGDYDFLPSKEAFPRARAAAERALEMDDSLAEAHASLAYVKYKYEWTWADAERGFERAIALDPNNAYARINYSLYLSNMGKHDEAIAEAKQALELDPLSIDINTCLGWIFYVARDYDRAIEQYQNTLEMGQGLIPARYFLAMSYVEKDMYSEAFAEVQKGIEHLGGEVPLLKSALGILYSLMGRRDEAMKELQNVIELSEQKYVGPDGIALIYTYLGKKDQAFEWLEKAYEERSAGLPQIKVEPMFDSLRSDPRFIAMLKKMNLE